MIVLLLAGGLLGCGTGEGPGTPTDAEQALPAPTFASMAGVGSFHLSASLKRTTRAASGEERVVEEAQDLRWGDPDRWFWQRSRDSRPVQTVLVHEGRAFAGREAAERPEPDAEPWRVQLAQAWDPWAPLGLVRGQYALERDSSADMRTIGGRRAWKHLLRALPEAPLPESAPPEAAKAPRKRARPWTLARAEGTAWLDEETAVTLEADAEVEARSKDGETRLLVLRVRVEGIGEAPSLPAPPAAGELAPLLPLAPPPGSDARESARPVQRR